MSVVARFNTRPKSDQPTLWVRMEYLDGFELEGLVDSDLLAFDPRRFRVVLPEQEERGHAEHGGRPTVWVCGWMLRSVVVLGTLNSDRGAKSRKLSSSA